MKLFNIALCLFCFSLFSDIVKAQPIEYTVSGKIYEGYLQISKDHKDAPFVLLIHDWNGLTEYEIKRADMLSEAGYNVFAIDMFGQGVRPETIEEKKNCTGELNSDREKMRILMQEALKIAESHGADIHRMVVAGYCFGGTCALELARSGVELKGFVSFHGGLATPENQNYSLCKGKILILHGAADSNISMIDFANLSKDMEHSNVDYEMIAYGGAPHAFTVFGEDRYRENADINSWQKFLHFLEDILG